MIGAKSDIIPSLFVLLLHRAGLQTPLTAVLNNAISSTHTHL